MRAKFAGAIAVAAVLVSLSCSDGTGPGNQSDGRISIINSPLLLNQYITYYADSTIPLEATGIGYSSLAPALSGSDGSIMVSIHTNPQFQLEAEIDPPVVGGQVLQATSATILDSLVVVSYGMRGSSYIGAVEVYQTSKEKKPEFRSRATFLNTDINAVTTDGANIFAAEATGDAGFASPAVAEFMDLVGSNLVLAGNVRGPLSSFAGTSVAVSGGKLYATSGDAGSLFVLNPVTMATTNSVSLHDARWVDVGGGKVVVVQGTPGKIAVFNESNLAPLGTYNFTGADVAESKSTVDVLGGKAFIAAGTGGVQVLSLATGAVVGSVPRPSAAALGLNPSVVVTNAAAVDEDLLFISNGEAGVYVAQGNQDFSVMSGETAQTITVLGRLGFSNLQSVNHVAFRDEYLFIAAGTGGLKIVRVK